MATHKDLVSGIGSVVEDLLSEAAGDVFEDAEYPFLRSAKEARKSLLVAIEDAILSVLERNVPIPSFFSVEEEQEVDVSGAPLPKVRLFS